MTAAGRVASSENALEVEELAVSFGPTDVFHGLSFSVPRGSSLAILGPNGCGKTVLFKTLAGSIPYRGRIRWADRVRIGYVPQKLDVTRDLPLSGRDLLRAKAVVSGDSEGEADAFRSVGLGADASKPIGALSGGQFQRLLVAVALVGRPDVLLLDEPTAGIDAPGQEHLNELVRRVQQERGLTVLLISHDLTVVYRYADNVLCLGHDRASFGPPRTILTPELLRKIYGSTVGYHVHAG